MVFLDTCVWIELCGVKTPEKTNEIKQAQLASGLLSRILENKEESVTCKEQLVEIISAIGLLYKNWFLDKNNYILIDNNLNCVCDSLF